MTDQASIDAAVAAVVARAGGLDILVNNAALFDLAPIVEITRESYDRLFSVNVAGTLFTMQAAARQMIAQGRGGKIINMASQAGRRGESLVAVYCATKAAVISLTQSAGLNLIRHGINVNAIAPGVVDGEHWEHVDAMFAKYEGKHARREEAPGRARACPTAAFATRRGPGRHGGLPRLEGGRLHRRPDLQRRRRPMDELTAAPPDGVPRRADAVAERAPRQFHYGHETLSGRRGAPQQAGRNKPRRAKAAPLEGGRKGGRPRSAGRAGAPSAPRGRRHSLGRRRSTPMDLGLSDKVAVITGGSVGIGLGVARAFAARGRARR